MLDHSDTHIHQINLRIDWWWDVGGVGVKEGIEESTSTVVIGKVLKHSTQVFSDAALLGHFVIFATRFSPMWRKVRRAVGKKGIVTVAAELTGWVRSKVLAIVWTEDGWLRWDKAQSLES